MSTVRRSFDVKPTYHSQFARADCSPTCLGLIQKDKNFAAAHSRHMTPTPVPKLQLAAALIGRLRQVVKASLTRLKMVWRFCDINFSHAKGPICGK